MFKSQKVLWVLFCFNVHLLILAILIIPQDQQVQGVKVI